MLAMGNTKPLNIKKGRMKKKFVIMACCCVLETVEIKSPMPSVLIRKIKVAPSNKNALPTIGILNHKMAKAITSTICAWEMIINGMVFPRISSKGFRGVTMSCSMVPDSLSRTIAMEVNSKERSMTKNATIPGT